MVHDANHKTHGQLLRLMPVLTLFRSPCPLWFALTL